MELPTHILLVYGYLLLFAWVLVEQFGIPAASRSGAAGRGSALARRPDQLSAGAAWRRRCFAHRRQRLVPRRAQAGPSRAAPSVQTVAGANHCVRRTQDSFGRRRGRMLMFAKFVPGLAILAAPVAGQNGMAFGAISVL